MHVNAISGIDLNENQFEADITLYLDWYVSPLPTRQRNDLSDAITILQSR